MEKKHQKTAIDWLNSNRDFSEGIQVLRSAGFRPAVVNKLEKVGEEGPAAKERLLHNIQMLVRSFADESLEEDTDPEVHIFEGKEAPLDSSVTAESKDNIFKAADSLPEGHSIKLLAKNYAQAYKNREQAFETMKRVGENNDPESVALRSRCSDIISRETKFMEMVYPIYSQYKETGTVPTAEAVEAVCKLNPEEETVDLPKQEESETETEQPSEDDKYDKMSKAELTELQYSLTRKITRAKCMLLYQSENKKDEENPLPDGPRRIKYETKISRLEPQLLAVKIALAKR